MVQTRICLSTRKINTMTQQILFANLRISLVCHDWRKSIKSKLSVRGSVKTPLKNEMEDELDDEFDDEMGVGIDKFGAQANLPSVDDPKLW